MSSDGINKQFGRPDNKKKLEWFMQDDENTMLYKPEDYSGNKFLGQWSKVFTMSSSLMLEDK